MNPAASCPAVWLPSSGEQPLIPGRLLICPTASQELMRHRASSCASQVSLRLLVASMRLLFSAGAPKSYHVQVCCHRLNSPQTPGKLKCKNLHIIPAKEAVALDATKEEN